MNKKLIGIVLAVMLGIILVESYFLFVQPNQTVSDSENTTDSTSQSPAASSTNESSTELPNSTTSREVPESNSFTPAIPEFSLKIADHSYEVPTTTSTDTYTGQTITNQGYHVENKTIDITIKNQPFVPPDNLTNLYHNIRVKGHFGEEWKELYSISNDTSQNTLPMQSASANTVISTPLDYPVDGRVDFQLEAVIATAHPFYGTPFGYWSYETSGWSSTQTLTIP